MNTFRQRRERLRLLMDQREYTKDAQGKRRETATDRKVQEIIGGACVIGQGIDHYVQDGYRFTPDHFRRLAAYRCRVFHFTQNGWELIPGQESANT